MENANQEELYMCERCGYKTNKKFALQRHLQNKKTCNSELSNTPRSVLLAKLSREYDDNDPKCDWCGKQFTHKNNLCTHRKKCKLNPSFQQNQRNEDNGEIHIHASEEDQRLHEQNQHINQETHINENVENPVIESILRTLLAKIHSLEEEIKTCKREQVQPTIIYNTTNNNTINNTFNISLNAHGKESIEHITRDMLMDFLKNRDILKLVKQIHFNPDVPENHNVKRITTSKDYYKNQFLATYEENGKWEHKKKEAVLQGVLNKGLNIMSTYLLENTNISNIDDEIVSFNNWLLQTNIDNKKYMKDVFALTLDDNFVLENKN